MRIRLIETHAVRIPLRPERRMVSALGRHTVSDYVLVQLTDDEGHVGVGEATVMPRWSGETVWSAQSIIDHVLAPQLIGCDVRDIAEIDRRMDAVCTHNWFAKSALEMACWDLHGRAVGQPIYELLGGACRPLVFRCRFSLGAYEPQRAAQIAAERVACGFTTIKVKVGGDPTADMARVRAVREAIGPQLELTVDANCGWDAETAIATLNGLADCRIALVEQPTPDGDYAAIAAVRRETGLPVMADDMCFNLVHARELLRQQACDVINIYPGKNGGIAKARAIARLAADAGVACSIGSNLEWDVATAAMAHLVAAEPNLQVERFPGDCLGPIYHEVRLVRQPVKIEGPLVQVPSGPGLGIEVDWELVEPHRLPGSQMGRTT
jgi:muconate cycloisomerase